MPPTLNVGLVGFGSIGKMHALAWQALGLYYKTRTAQVRLAMVCAASEKTCADARARLGVPATTSYEELLAHPDISLVDITTPPYMHEEMVTAALRAGKHVYCEKPLAATLPQAQNIVKVAGEVGRDVQVAFTYRFVPCVMRAQQLVAEGKIGRVYGFRSQYLRPSLLDPTNVPAGWKISREQSGGGALLDLGIHVVDMVRLLAGEPKRVLGQIKTFIPERGKPGATPVRVEVEDSAIVQLELDNGAIGVIEATKLATGSANDFIFELHGSAGALRFNLMDPNWLYYFDATQPKEPLGGLRGYQRLETLRRYPDALLPGPDVQVGIERFHIASIHSFVSSVVSGQPYAASLADGLQAQKIVAAAYQSAHEKRWVDM